MSVQSEYRNRNPRGHWFDASSTRFFKTRMGAEHGRWVRHGRDRKLVYVFVTSEKGPSGVRRHSVRFMDKAGEIRTVGDFNAYSRSVANRIARQLADDGETRTPEGDHYRITRDGALVETMLPTFGTPEVA